MKHLLATDPTVKGKTMLILDCPWKEKHVERDSESGITGPSFAVCAYCEYQRGINLELRDLDHDWMSEPFPERLKCGFNENNGKLRLVKS